MRFVSFTKLDKNPPKAAIVQAKEENYVLGVAVVSRRDSIGKAVRGLMTRATAALTMVAVSKCCQKAIRLFFIVCSR